ncbi:YcaO-like family protein [Roseibium sp.]|uniref:YcaO-like family protein n=1 Tax=Roseibium sp. TaxID=1936156 RepID=UPI003B500087
MPNADGGAGLFTHPELDLFLPLLARHEVRLVPMVAGQCPVKFCTGTIKSRAGHGQQGDGAATTIPAGGQADTSSSAALSCLGELSERLSLCSLGRRDQRVEIDLKLQSEIEMTKVLGYSARQLRAFARGQGLGEGRPGSCGPESESFSARAVNVRRLGDGALSSYPSAGVLFGEFELISGRAGGFASTVGCAVWRDHEGARQRALLELVERDAVAQAWYNRLGITLISEELVKALLPLSLVLHLKENKRFWGLYSVATDLKVHIVLSVSCEPDGRRAAIGSAAGWDLASASKSAVTEMLQSENALDLMERAYLGARSETDKPRRLPRHLAYATKTSVFADFLSKAVGPHVPPGSETVYAYSDLLDSCSRKGIDIWEFDATRSDLGIPCIKLISEHLCSWEPRFGKERLYQGVVDRGLRKQRADESEFEARPFPF